MGGTTSQRWIEVQVRSPARLIQPVQALLGIISDIPLTETGGPTGDLWRITGGIAEDTLAVKKLKRLEKALRKLEQKEGLTEPFFVDLQVMDQARKSRGKNGEEAVFEGERIVVCPSSFKGKPCDDGKILFSIDPMDAFGDGYHPSTVIGLVLLERVFAGDCGNVPETGWILDAGCGTAILGLAAAALGKSYVLGVDISEEAILAAKANQERNHEVGDRMRLVRGGFPCCRGPYCLVLANLVASVQTLAWEYLWHTTGPGGYIILSGFSKAQKKLVTGPYLERGAEVRASFSRNQWMGVVLAKSR